MSMITNDWLEPLSSEFRKGYYSQLYNFVKDEYSKTVVYPPAEDIGLSLSVQPGQDIPPSLVNIYKELHDDLGCYIPNNGYLKKWADQGVLLLNTVLTVRAHQANSHQGHGWEQFTDAVIQAVNAQDRPIVYMLWGAPARRKKAMLTNPKHLILEAPHPSPLSAYRGFFGCKHFSKANEFLKASGLEPIDWQIENI